MKYLMYNVTKHIIQVVNMCLLYIGDIDFETLIHY